MRKSMICIIASLITLTAASSAFAQETRTRAEAEAQQKHAEATRMQFGIVGLLNYSTTSFSADNQTAADAANDLTGYKLGFGGGLRAIVPFTPLIGLQAEILFKQYGTSSEMDLGPLGTIESTTTMNYLHVPILARVAIPLDGPITPKVLAGPTFGYFISGSAKSGDQDAVDIDADEVNRLDIGAAAGIGADINVGPGSISLDLRYDRSFTSIAKEQEGDPSDLSAVNTGFSFLVGYNYAF